MATATEIQAQIDAEKQAHARRLAELEQKMLIAEHDELTERITTHADTLAEDENRSPGTGPHSPRCNPPQS